MCQAIIKPAGKVVDFKKLDKAQLSNKDGYGVSWYEDDRINTFKTLNYNRFKGVLATLKDKEIIIHLRNATKGKVTVDNIHPFDIPSGVMYHNGTIFSLKGTIQDEVSDTYKLASILNDTKYNKIEDVEVLLKAIVGDTINRLVFMDKTDGKITVINKELGMIEDGIWYSNDYHKKERCCTTKTNTAANKTEYAYNPISKRYEPRVVDFYDSYEDMLDYDAILDYEQEELVFVYGTLKRGYSNNRLLNNATYLGKATTMSRWAMIGKNMPFPYLLEIDPKGHKISGEVYAVDKNTKRALDRLEGTPHHYKETDISITYNDTKEAAVVSTYVKTNVTKEDKLKPLIATFTK
jgi:gamma-glutamylaminecyclotransferase